MLWTAPGGWVNLGGGIICSTIRKSLVKNALSPEEEKRLKKKPNHQMLWTVPDGSGYFVGWA